VRDRGLPVGAAAVDELRALEELSNALAARRARVTASFVAAQKADQIAQGVPAERVGRGVAAQVGLARRISPFEATRYVGQVQILTTELPETFARLEAGEVSEWRVLKVAEHTAWLSREHRLLVDAEIAPNLHRLGTRAIVNRTRAIGYRLDPHGYMDRLQQAESERRVSVRPTMDCMATLATHVSMKQAVAGYASLSSYADLHVGIGDETRTRDQIMADTMIERITGQTTANAVPVEVNLIMTDQALLSYGDNPDEPVHLVGGGTIPAELARRMVDDADTVFLRRLFTHPTTGQLAAMETKARLFTANQRKFLILRDQTCRTPWCDAPIRHADHITPADHGGETSIANGQGLCQACNHAKQAPGWHQQTEPDGTITTTTPTGHRYQSHPPEPPGRGSSRERYSHLRCLNGQTTANARPTMVFPEMVPKTRESEESHLLSPIMKKRPAGMLTGAKLPGSAQALLT
jgi:hypothetical protein